MLRESLLPYSLRSGEVVPHFLGAADAPWLRALFDEFDRCVGRPQRDLDQRLSAPLSPPTPLGKWRLASEVLKRIVAHKATPPLKRKQTPRQARALLFGAAAHATLEISVWQTVATELKVSTEELSALLFADVPCEQKVAALPTELSLEELSLRANLALAQALLFRSSHVHISLYGNARAIVRHAHLRGLLCTVHASSQSESAELEISGPLALFHRTLLYGKTLSELLPLLAWCSRFRLRAECQLKSGGYALRLGSGDPIFPSIEPRRFDSKLEANFARDFARATLDWDLVREPEPIAAGRSLIFPDFELRHRNHPAKSWLLEIVGFWTPAYLDKKLAQYRAAKIERLILCIDENLACAASELPGHAHILRFRRRIDPQAVLSVIQ